MILFTTVIHQTIIPRFAREAKMTLGSESITNVFSTKSALEIHYH
jgi:hypothetical protein